MSATASGRRRAVLALRIVVICALIVAGVIILPKIEMIPMELPYLQSLLPRL